MISRIGYIWILQCFRFQNLYDTQHTSLLRRMEIVMQKPDEILKEGVD